MFLVDMFCNNVDSFLSFHPDHRDTLMDFSPADTANSSDNFQPRNTLNPYLPSVSGKYFFLIDYTLAYLHSTV